MDNKKPVYMIRCYIHGSCCLVQAYANKGNAAKTMEKRIKSDCFDKVQLNVQYAVYELILKEWERE